jgi:hypothetical protein
MMDFDAYIKKHTPTEKAKKLRDRLFQIENNKEFVALTIDEFDTEEKRQKMLDILSEWNLSPSDVVLVSMAIAEGIEPEIYEAE